MLGKQRELRIVEIDEEVVVLVDVSLARFAGPKEHLPDPHVVVLEQEPRADLMTGACMLHDHQVT